MRATFDTATRACDDGKRLVPDVARAHAAMAEART